MAQKKVAAKPKPPTTIKKVSSGNKKLDTGMKRALSSKKPKK